MYLVELRPGKEELYRSGDDLAAAIRRGDVDVHSRIYHRATSKWISVTLHPQFKAIVAEKAAEPLPPLERSQWTYLTDQAETLQATDGSMSSDGSGETPSMGGGHPWRRFFGLGVAGTALVLGAQLAFSGPRPPWSDDRAAAPATDQQPAATTEVPAEPDQVVSLASTSTAWQPSAAVYQPAAAAPAPAEAPAPPALPSAPKLRLKTLKEVLPGTTPEARAAEANTVEGLLARYGDAYLGARERLERGIRVAQLNQLFAPARLSPDGGLTDTRLALAGVANFIRVYREQETAIEREYQDSFTVTSKQHSWSSRAVRRWYSRSAQKEPAAFAALSTRLIGTLDTLLGVLDEESGAYTLGE
ncbi:MAG TPA: hypothetical protein VEB59_14900, partial [Gemmatimonadales bacterium]|nr:hypothetical protein [Gemmatimonadales bacterium]